MADGCVARSRAAALLLASLPACVVAPNPKRKTDPDFVPTWYNDDHELTLALIRLLANPWTLVTLIAILVLLLAYNWRQYKRRGEQGVEWAQNLYEVTVTLKMPPELTSKDVVCRVMPTHLTLGFKGQKQPALQGNFAKPVTSEDHLWEIEKTADGTRVIKLTIVKAKPGKWKSLFEESQGDKVLPSKPRKKWE